MAPPRAPSLRDGPRAARPRQAEGGGWIASGLYVMTLPLAISVGMMLAPMVWMFGGRPRQS